MLTAARSVLANRIPVPMGSADAQDRVVSLNVLPLMRTSKGVLCGDELSFADRHDLGGQFRVGKRGLSKAGERRLTRSEVVGDKQAARAKRTDSRLQQLLIEGLFVIDEDQICALPKSGQSDKNVLVM